MKSLISGELTYMTYMVMSVTCFFLWMAPNFNKIRRFFSSSSSSTQESEKMDVDAEAQQLLSMRRYQRQLAKIQQYAAREAYKQMMKEKQAQ